MPDVDVLHEVLTAASLRRRVPLYHADFPFVILWSQKAACTTVAKWFFYQLGMLTPQMTQGIGVHKVEWEYKTRRGYVKEMLRAIESGRPVIKFVRDPYARSYSSYLGMCSKGSVLPTFWGGTRKQIVTYLAGPEAPIDHSFSFTQFLEWLQATGSAPVNLHISPQHMERDNLMRVRVVKIEQLKQAFLSVEREFSLSRTISDSEDLFDSGHHNIKTQIARDEALRFLDLPVPIGKPDGFKLVQFGKELAKHTKFDALVHASFSVDIAKYHY